MAVIVKYVVVRDGEEKMTFATKKEADAHDRMLDIADNLYEFFKAEKFELDESQMESVSLRLAREKDNILKILRGGKLSVKELNKGSGSSADSSTKEDLSSIKEAGGKEQKKKSPKSGKGMSKSSGDKEGTRGKSIKAKS